MSKQGAFCFVKGELVDCIPGRVQDCNMKQLHECPLDKKDDTEKKADKKPKNADVKENAVKSTKSKKAEKANKSGAQAFCFIKGELVDCIPGRVQDCNMKQLHECPLDKKEDTQKRADKSDIRKNTDKSVKVDVKEKDGKSKKAEKAGKTGAQAFCFIKGELVDCIPGRVQDCNMKQLHECPLDKKEDTEKKADKKPEKSDKKENAGKSAKDKKTEKAEKTNGFCFCKGELVSCSKGRIQDCNNKQLHECPLA